MVTWDRRCIFTIPPFISNSNSLERFSISVVKYWPRPFQQFSAASGRKRCSEDNWQKAGGEKKRDRRSESRVAGATRIDYVFLC